jgi:hypothetical protein
MDGGKLQGWQADPFGLHEARYFSAGRPTKLVRDGAVEYYDEPPPEQLWPPQPPPPAEPQWQPAEPQWQPVEPQWQPVEPAELGERASDLNGMLTLEPLSEWADPAPPRSRPGAAFVAAAMIIGGTIGGLIAVAHQGSAAASPGATGSSAAFVAASAQQTLAQKTAEATISGTLQFPGATAQLRGNGALDFTTSSMTLSMTATSSGASFAQRVVMTSKYIYIAFTSDGRALTAGGRHWMQWPNLGSEPVSMTDLDLSSVLSSLERPGSGVTALGTKKIDGQYCYGYTVSPAGQAGAQQSATMVWAGSDHLLCEMSVVIQASSAAGPFSAAGQLVIDFTHYGASVRIVIPAQSDTASGQQWLSTVGREATAL